MTTDGNREPLQLESLLRIARPIRSIYLWVYQFLLKMAACLLTLVHCKSKTPNSCLHCGKLPIRRSHSKEEEPVQNMASFHKERWCLNVCKWNCLFVSKLRGNSEMIKQLHWQRKPVEAFFIPPPRKLIRNHSGNRQRTELIIRINKGAGINLHP